MTIKHDKVLPAHPLKIHETRPSPTVLPDAAVNVMGRSHILPPDDQGLATLSGRPGL